MKKILYVALSIITAGIWVASCTNGGSGGNAEKLREDSIRIADSIAEEEAAKAQALQAAEQVRLDSLRQDSIEEREKVLANIPSMVEIIKNGDPAPLFRKRGFKVKIERYTVDTDMLLVTATYNPGNGISCKYTEGVNDIRYTIKGAPELLEKFYSEAKVFSEKDKTWNVDIQDWEGWEITKKGDTIIAEWCGLP